MTGRSPCPQCARLPSAQPTTTSPPRDTSSHQCLVSATPQGLRPGPQAALGDRGGTREGVWGVQAGGGMGAVLGEEKGSWDAWVQGVPGEREAGGCRGSWGRGRVVSLGAGRAQGRIWGPWVPGVLGEEGPGVPGESWGAWASLEEEDPWCQGGPWVGGGPQGSGLWGAGGIPGWLGSQGILGWWVSQGAGLWGSGGIPEPLSLQTIGAGSC